MCSVGEICNPVVARHNQQVYDSLPPSFLFERGEVNPPFV
jgi:hypothetical protein